jgi:hypothetical protein
VLQEPLLLMLLSHALQELLIPRAAAAQPWALRALGPAAQLAQGQMQQE